MKRVRGKYFTALETVDFQNSTFGNQLNAIVDTIYDKLKNDVVKASKLINEPEIKLIQDLIFKYKGLRVKMVLDSEPAAILPFYPNKNLNLLESFIRGNFTIADQEKIIKASNGKKGTIDLKNAKVGGVFSEGTSILFINFNILIKTFGCTPSEITAFILHELGHAFSACEYSDRFTRTNQVLADVSREIFSKKDKKNLDYVFKELKTVNKNITIEEADALVNGDRIVAGARWHKFLIDTIVSEMSIDKYNQNSYEQLADSFATRHGYGKEIVTGLDKLHLTTGGVEKFALGRAIAYTCDLLINVASVVVIAAAAPTIPILAVIVGGIFGLRLYNSGDGERDNTYDELKQRYTRVRMELISLLKDQNISNEIVNQTVDSIKTIDLAISTTSDYKPLSRYVSNFIFSSNRNAAKDIEYQKNIESLVNNDLFLYAAQLKTV